MSDKTKHFRDFSSLLLNKCFIKIDHFAFLINPTLTLDKRNMEGFQ